MMISIIVAMDKNGLIGKKDSLPWKFSEDLKHFKEKTIGKSVIMGQKTYQGIKKPLKGRDLIVLSNDLDFSDQSVKIARSIEDALKLANGEVFIAGGASVYQQFLEIADKMYLTIINQEFEGDVYFPKFNRTKWELIEEKKGQNKLLTFKTYKKNE